jgi:outer membrane protein
MNQPKKIFVGQIGMYKQGNGNNLNILQMKRILYCLIVFGALTSSVTAQSILSLEEAVDAALKNNFDIRVSRHESEITQANNTLGNAGMLPTVDLNANVEASQNASRQVATDGTVTNTSPFGLSANAGVEMNWTLFDGGKMFVTREKLREAEHQGEYRFRETVQQTMYEVVAAYYDIVRLQQQLRSVEQTIRYNRERVNITETGFRAGSMAKTDLLQARIDLNEAIESEITQKYAVREAKRALNILLARDADVSFLVNDSIPKNFTPDKKALFNQLNTNNVSLLAFQKQLAIDRLAFAETKSNFLPRFNLSAGYYFAQSSTTDGKTSRSSDLGPQVAGSLTMPIYQAGESKRLRKVAELNLQTTEADLEKIRLEMNLALRNALDDFDNQQELLAIEQENNLLAKEYLEISIQRLRLGQTTSLEVHQAQENFVNSDTRLINYRYSLKLAETKLKQLVSEL